MDNISIACHRLHNKDSSLTLLNLSCEGIGNEGVKKLCNSCSCSDDRFPPHSPLVALWLENNEIYPKGALALNEVILASPSLKYLYMAHNSINNSGVKSISESAFRQLEVCNLADNSITHLGARTIAENLRARDSQLKSLILESNQLRDEGTKLIAEGLRENETLKSLDLRYNKIGKSGLTALRDALVKENTTLEVLLLEEEQDVEKDHPIEKPPRRRLRKDPPCPKLLKESKRLCKCDCCKLRAEIEYYLALNRAGRRSFGNVQIPTALWPRIMSHVTQDDPSLLYAILAVRPDVMSSSV